MHLINTEFIEPDNTMQYQFAIKFILIKIKGYKRNYIKYDHQDRSLFRCDLNVILVY